MHIEMKRDNAITPSPAAGDPASVQKRDRVTSKTKTFVPAAQVNMSTIDRMTVIVIWNI
jgi:hypothetical protein